MWKNTKDRDKLKIKYITWDIPSVTDFIKIELRSDRGKNWNNNEKTKWRREARQKYREDSIKKPKFEAEALKNFRGTFDKLLSIMWEYTEAVIENMKIRMTSWVDEKWKKIPPKVSLKELEAVMTILTPMVLHTDWLDDDETKNKSHYIDRLKKTLAKQQAVKEELKKRGKPPVNW